MVVEIMKRIISEKKTNLPSIRIQDWRTFKSESGNDLLTNIPTNNITELNDLINTGAKLVCEKIGVLLKTTDKISKPVLEIRLETLIGKLRQVEILKNVQLEETNQKALVKER